MPPTPQQRTAFQARLRDLMRARDVSLKTIAEALPQHGGDKVSAQAISNWLNTTNNAPGRHQAIALARALGEPDGTFAELLGYRLDDPGTDARFERLEQRVNDLDARLTRQTQMLEELLDPGRDDR